MKNLGTSNFPPEISKYFFWAWLILLMSIATYIRVQGASEYHYYQDEAMHFSIAKGQTLLEVLRFSLYEQHPPLFYVLLHYWLMLSDTQAFARGFSLLCGLCTIPLYYAIGKTLNGELTGMLAATLVTFGLGLIEQSYLVRQYSLFIFLLSLCFYSYICWHNNRSSIALAVYAMFGTLSCMTHFSGIFAVFSLACAETIYMFIRKIEWREQAVWAFINISIGFVWLSIFYLWQPVFKYYYPFAPSPHSLSVVLVVIILALQDPYLIFPNAAAAALWVCLLPLAAAYSIRKRDYFLVMPWTGISLDIVLKAGFIYPNSGRHELWLTPFIIPLTAWLLAECGYLLPERYLKSPFWRYVLVCTMFIAGIWMYNPEARFSDKREYLLQETQWQALRNYVYSLGPDHLVYAERAESLLLTPYNNNSYAAVSETPDTSPSSTVIVPVGKTHLMFRKYYMYYDHGNFIHLLKQAQQNGTLDGINTIIFTITSVSRTAAHSLLSCTALDKRIDFPSLDPQRPFATDSGSYPVILLEVSKKALFEEAIAETGKAHYCLQGKEN